MTIIKDFFADKLHVMVFDTREAMGRMAGEQAAAASGSCWRKKRRSTSFSQPHPPRMRPWKPW